MNTSLIRGINRNGKSVEFGYKCVDTKVVFYWDQPFLVGWVGWVFLCSSGENPFVVGLVDQPFQPASNRVEMVEIVIVAHLTTIPRSYRVSTKNGWESVLLRRVNRIDPNRLRLKRLIPIEHDLNVNWVNAGVFPLQARKPHLYWRNCFLSLPFCWTAFPNKVNLKRFQCWKVEVFKTNNEMAMFLLQRKLKKMRIIDPKLLRDKLIR